MGVRRVAPRDRALGRPRGWSTGCASTTPTACSTPAATSTCCTAAPTARTCWSRRSSRVASSCRRRGATDGTTGYDALADVDRVLVDPAGRAALDAARRRAARRAAPTGRADARREALGRRHHPAVGGRCASSGRSVGRPRRRDGWPVRRCPTPSPRSPPAWRCTGPTCRVGVEHLDAAAADAPRGDVRTWPTTSTGSSACSPTRASGGTAVPADLGHDHGQGRRGPCVLPVQPARRR